MINNYLFNETPVRTGEFNPIDKDWSFPTYRQGLISLTEYKVGRDTNCVTPQYNIKNLKEPIRIELPTYESNEMKGDTHSISSEFNLDLKDSPFYHLCVPKGKDTDIVTYHMEEDPGSKDLSKYKHLRIYTDTEEEALNGSMKAKEKPGVYTMTNKDFLQAGENSLTLMIKPDPALFQGLVLISDTCINATITRKEDIDFLTKELIAVNKAARYTLFYALIRRDEEGKTIYNNLTPYRTKVPLNTFYSPDRGGSGNNSIRKYSITGMNSISLAPQTITTFGQTGY
jgi:hypothetical protein